MNASKDDAQSKGTTEALDPSLLAGRTVLITGAGAGIGEAEAVLFARHGANVVVNDVGADPGGSGTTDGPANAVVDRIRALGGRAVASLDDISSFAGGDAAVRTALDAFGGLDIVVNNAAVTRHSPSWEQTQEDWDTVLRVSLTGTFAVSRAAVDYWRAAGWRRERSAAIINTTSDAGVFGQPDRTAYSAAKAGTIGLTLAMARELAEFGIRVNAIAPIARTRLMKRAMEGTDRWETTALPQPGDPFDLLAPEHVAAVACWLASDACASVTGQTIRVQGGAIEALVPARRGRRIESSRPWTVASITAQHDSIFDGGSAFPEAFPKTLEEMNKIRASIAQTSSAVRTRDDASLEQMRS
jgi:NAD(P)-dependent dehydrogenase (short-subunit alcohol dehydrogenase family)